MGLRGHETATQPITFKLLRTWARDRAVEPGPIPPQLSSAYGPAFFVLNYYLGDDWVQRVLIKSRGGFMCTDFETAERGLTHVMRVVALGEMVFNFQGTEGFGACLDQLRTGEIEATFAKFEVARVLAANNVRFRFIRPQGKRGSDYDLELYFPEGMLACADTKCKLETTAFTSNSLTNVLSAARGQLPKDRPGVIFVKVPPEWWGVENALEEFFKTTTAFFRGTKRVVSVQIYSTVMKLEPPRIFARWVGQQYTNLIHRFDGTKMWNLVETGVADAPLAASPPWWTNFMDFYDERGRFRE